MTHNNAPETFQAQYMTIRDIFLTEGLVDGQVRLDDEHGCAGCLGLLEDVTSPPVEHSVDTAHRVLRTLEKE